MDNTRSTLWGDEWFACFCIYHVVWLCVPRLTLFSFKAVRIFCLLSKIKTEILFPFICFRVGCQTFQPEKWAKNVFYIAAEEGRVRATHSHTFTHLGVVEYHQCHCILLTDHLHQSLRSVRLHGLCLREMRKGKIGPVQGEIKLSSCSVRLCTHTLCLAWLLLAAPPSPLLYSHPFSPASAVGTCAVSNS